MIRTHTAEPQSWLSCIARVSAPINPFGSKCSSWDNLALTSEGKERKLPVKALKERAAGFGERDAAGGASRGKNLLAVAPEPEGRKRKRE